MKSLVELMHSQKAAGTLAAITKAEMGLATFAVLGGALGATKAQKFSDGAASLVTSDEFLNELESELGLPEQGETEDEFVTRAKASMLGMLKAKLK